jgi:hypothetical protein
LNIEWKQPGSWAGVLAIQQFDCLVSPMGSIVDGLPAVPSGMNKQNNTHSEAQPAPAVVRYIVTSLAASSTVKIMRNLQVSVISFSNYLWQ